MRHTKAFKFWTNPGVAKGFSRGVSLHSHTTYSRESLEFIPKYAQRSKILAKVMGLAEWQYHSRTGNVLDCSRAFWTPPLSPAMAIELEAGQIRKAFDLPAMVSLTDHDNCMAGNEGHGPVSIEWTIPMQPSFFHLGVHNLPREQAGNLVAEMNAYTANPQPARLQELLSALHQSNDVLIVLNHPLWDEGLIGAGAHRELLSSFLDTNRQWIHAIEWNGLRSAEENERAAELAEQLNLPVISGGDRHGREPNANVNLTKMNSFGDFVQEVRFDKVSEVVFMPQYREPLRLRQFETAWDILRYDRNRADGRNSWCDRVFFTCERNHTRPLSYFFGETGPKILVPFLAAMRLLEQPAVRPMLRAALSD